MRKGRDGEKQERDALLGRRKNNLLQVLNMYHWQNADTKIQYEISKLRYFQLCQNPLRLSLFCCCILVRIVAFLTQNFFEPKSIFVLYLLLGPL